MPGARKNTEKYRKMHKSEDFRSRTILAAIAPACSAYSHPLLMVGGQHSYNNFLTFETGVGQIQHVRFTVNIVSLRPSLALHTNGTFEILWIPLKSRNCIDIFASTASAEAPGQVIQGVMRLWHCVAQVCQSIDWISRPLYDIFDILWPSICTTTALHIHYIRHETTGSYNLHSCIVRQLQDLARVEFERRAWRVAKHQTYTTNQTSLYALVKRWNPLSVAAHLLFDVFLLLLLPLQHHHHGPGLVLRHSGTKQTQANPQQLTQPQWWPQLHCQHINDQNNNMCYCYHLPANHLPAATNQTLTSNFYKAMQSWFCFPPLFHPYILYFISHL